MQDRKNVKVTMFKSLWDLSHPYFVDEAHVYDRIRTGRSKHIIEEIRSSTDKGLMNTLKRNLPCVCFSGTFKERRDNALIQHSGLVITDFDDASNPNALKDMLKKDKYVRAVFISPSGKGVKAVVAIPPEPEKHGLRYNALEQHFDFPDSWDTSGRNISRVCYESYDPHIYVNFQSKVFDLEVADFDVMPRDIEPWNVDVGDDEILRRLQKWAHNKESFSRGGRNAFIFKLASAYNRFGVPFEQANHFLLSSYKQPDCSDAAIVSAVKSAYRYKDKHGEALHGT